MKRKLVFGLCLLMCGLLVIYSPAALKAAKGGFELFITAVLPALLPYFICTALMRSCGVLRGRLSLVLYALALISGAPAGAKCAGAMTLDKKPSTALSAALNAVSPAFIAGGFCVGMIGVPALAAPILIGQYVSALVMLLPMLKYRPSSTEGELSFAGSVHSAMDSLICVCGTIVFFSVAIGICDAVGITGILCSPISRLFARAGWNPDIPRALLLGIFEFVTGAKALMEVGASARVIAGLAAGMFSFGGLCVMAQSGAFVRLSAPSYIIRKLIQGVLAGVTAYLVAPLFLKDAEVSVVNGERLLQNSAVLLGTLISVLTGMAVVLLFAAAASGINRRRADAASAEQSSDA